VRYLNSDEWDTNRDDSLLDVDTFIPKHLLGFNLMSGNKDAIHALKMRQRQSTRPIDLSPYIEKHLGEKMSLAKMEQSLIRAWIEELTEGYSITPPDDKEMFIKGMTAFRTFAAFFMTRPIPTIKLLWNNAESLRYMKSYFLSLDNPTQMIMGIPFLTTIDTSILNFASSEKPISEFHELFQNTPVVYVPIAHKRGAIILKIVSNKANNPGNSVFGPKGLICPGNMVTSMLMKAVADLKSQFVIKIDGELKFEDGILKRITNLEDVFVTFLSRQEYSGGVEMDQGNQA